MTLTTLNLAKKTALNPARFERWQRRRIAERTFAELWEEANPTLQPGCRFHRYCGLWLELADMVPLSGSHRAITGEQCEPERTLVQGEPKFESEAELPQ